MTDLSFAFHLRQLHAAPPGTQGRAALRAALTAHLGERLETSLAEGQPERAWESLAAALRLYEPAELVAGELDPRIASMSRLVVNAYEPRGHEARVLASLLALGLAEPTDPDHASRYREVATWTEEARRAIPSEAERVVGLIGVYEPVADVLPLAEPVDRLAALYLRRHGLLRSTFGGPAGLSALFGPGRGLELQGLLASRGRTVPDLVALYLRAGREEELRRAVDALGPISPTDREMVRAVRDLSSDRRGARARVLLASTLGAERPAVALRLCHEGRRQYPSDTSFCLCLAELYRSAGDSDGALEYYEAMLENDRSVETFDQVLRFVAMELEIQLADEDPRRSRETFTRAERILASLAEHHPSREPPIRPDQLAFLVGMGEFNAGNIDEAVARLEASVETRPNRSALVQLGIIAERRGETEQAVRLYRQALDLREGSQENPLSRAVILGHLAEAYGLAGDAARRRGLYEEALEMLRLASTSMPPDAGPAILIERGTVLYELGLSTEGREELRQALTAGSRRQSSYGRLLSFFVRQGLVDEALEVFSQAFNHSELERIWRIFFSMWVVGVQRLQGREPDATAMRFLESIRGDEWVERLGRHNAGTLSYEELVASAETRGQLAEAHYYESVLRLAAGRRDEAEGLLRQVLATDMMGYYEYDFARRLLRDLAAGAPAPAAPER